MKSNSFFDSLKNAFLGIRETAKRERNFRIQIVVACLAVLVCIVFRVSTETFVLTAFAIFFVLGAELVNTAVEAIVDIITQKRPHPLAKVAKDAAAGAVLLASVFAVVVGIVVITDIVRRFM